MLNPTAATCATSAAKPGQTETIIGAPHRLDGSDILQPGFRSRWRVASDRPSPHYNRTPVQSQPMTPHGTGVQESGGHSQLLASWLLV